MKFKNLEEKLNFLESFKAKKLEELTDLEFCEKYFEYYRGGKSFSDYVLDCLMYSFEWTAHSGHMASIYKTNIKNLTPYVSNDFEKRFISEQLAEHFEKVDSVWGIRGSYELFQELLNKEYLRICK